MGGRLRATLPLSRLPSLHHAVGGRPLRSASVPGWGTEKSADAIRDDAVLERTVELVESVLRVAPDCLVTIENPRGPWFAGLPVIKRLLADPRWHLMVGSYCKLAGPLDGARAWPRKHTYILAYNVPPLLELSVCRNDCTHLLPGTRA